MELKLPVKFYLDMDCVGLLPCTYHGVLTYVFPTEYFILNMIFFNVSSNFSKFICYGSYSSWTQFFMDVCRSLSSFKNYFYESCHVFVITHLFKI